MQIILSPAKLFNEVVEIQLKTYHPTCFQEQTDRLIQFLKGFDGRELSKWMKMSNELGELNASRYQAFDTLTQGYYAIDYFNGEAYKALDGQSLANDERSYLDAHLLILSGLYGCMKGLSIIKPYRLEMGTRFENWCYKDLYV